MGNYSKFIGTVVGFAVGWLVTKFALPADLGSKEIIDALTLLITSGVGVYFAPKNTEA